MICVKPIGLSEQRNMKGCSACPHPDYCAGMEKCDAAHVHEWKPVGIVTEKRLVSDGRRDRYVRVKLAVLSCGCGAIYRREVGRV